MKLNTVLLIVLIVLAGAWAMADIGMKMQSSAVAVRSTAQVNVDQDNAAREAEERWHTAHCLRDRNTGEWYGCH